MAKAKQRGKKTTGVVDWLKERGHESDFDTRGGMFTAMFEGEDYKGTASQNIRMLRLLRKMEAGWDQDSAPIRTAVAHESETSQPTVPPSSLPSVEPYSEPPMAKAAGLQRLRPDEYEVEGGTWMRPGTPGYYREQVSQAPVSPPPVTPRMSTQGAQMQAFMDQNPYTQANSRKLSEQSARYLKQSGDRDPNEAGYLREKALTWGGLK